MTLIRLSNRQEGGRCLLGRHIIFQQLCCEVKEMEVLFHFGLTNPRLLLDT